MERFLSPLAPSAYALLRAISGLLFVCHGAQKLLGWFGGLPEGVTVEPFGLVWWAGVIEVVGGLLIGIGLFSGWAAFVCSGQMAVAYFMAHQPRGLLPIVNGGELAVLYCFVFLLIATRGDGTLALGPALGLGGRSAAR
jgi:putative oxidoreductase